MLLDTVTLKLNGSIYFINNGAIVEGELLKHLNEESISLLNQIQKTLSLPWLDFDANKSNLSFAGNVCVNSARLKGGAIQALIILSAATYNNISFTQNHADVGGGALYDKDYQCSFGSIHPIEFFFFH